MSLARVFCSWSIAAILLLLSIAFSNSAESGKSLDPVVTIDNENGEEGNGTKNNVTLTGNPQIDYVHDPNLPRELNGYNLSDYPFYHRVPPNINFSCDGRKDGFYASVEHKCQIYHHCLFGSRYDFICANYTAFDQRTFICQFVSDVDCPNSHMYFHRNKDLYVSKSTTTSAPLYIDRNVYTRRPGKKHKNRPRLAGEVGADGGTAVDKPTTETPSSAAPPGDDGNSAPAPPPKRKDAEYSEDDYYDEDLDYQVRRPARPPRRRFRKCRNGRRRGRRCRPRRPLTYYYDDDDYSYDDDYDYAYYDDVRPRKGGKRRRPLNAIPAGTSQVTSTSSSETPAPTTSTTTTTTTTTETPPLTSSESSSGPLDFDSIAVLQTKREELLKARRPAWRPSRQNDKTRSSSSTTTTSTTTERVKPSSTTSTTSTTTEVPQYIYDYEYYEDDTAAVDQVSSSSTTTTTTTTVKPFLRGKFRPGAGSSSPAAVLLEKQRVQQSVQVKVTEDSGTSTNTIRRRDNSNVQTPTRVATAPSSTSTTSTTPASTTPVNRPARFWQRKSTVKSISTTTAPSTTTTTTTTLAPYYQEYQDYEDEAEVDPQPTAPAKPLPPPKPQPSRPSNRFQAISNPPQHQYGTSPAAALQQPASYANNAPSASYASNAPSASPQLQQQAVTSTSRGHASSLSSSYAAARPNKHYAMQQHTPQQYSQTSSSSSSNSNSNSNRDSTNYNTNSYHRQRTPAPVVPKPEFISLVDEDYNNPYASGPSGSTSPSSTRYHGGGGGGSVSAALGSPGYHHQHPIRFFEQHQPPSFLFGAASEYNNPQFAFPPRNYPSPSNFQPYGHSTRRFAPHMFKKR